MEKVSDVLWLDIRKCLGHIEDKLSEIQHNIDSIRASEGALIRMGKPHPLSMVKEEPRSEAILAGETLAQAVLDEIDKTKTAECKHKDSFDTDEAKRYCRDCDNYI